MIWVVEIVIFLAFVGFGGFEGFIAWAVLTAIVMFWRHSNAQAKLKAAEVMLQAERVQLENARASEDHAARLQAPKKEPAPSLWASDFGKIDFRTMTADNVRMVRRLSATEWEWKNDPETHKTFVEACRLVAEDATTTEELRANARTFLEKFPEAIWQAIPEKFVAAIETHYQRYLLHGDG